VIGGAGLVDIELSNPVDAFAGALGEANARQFGTYGYSIRARKPAAALEATGQTCATLTPLVQARIRPLDSGDLLRVSTDDPAAREGIAAWCRVTGHPLVSVVDGADGQLSFLIRKK
jgi:tRNA 2-thiouridine synthesizing protein A/cysteine desulfurase